MPLWPGGTDTCVQVRPPRPQDGVCIAYFDQPVLVRLPSEITKPIKSVSYAADLLFDKCPLDKLNHGQGCGAPWWAHAGIPLTRVENASVPVCGGRASYRQPRIAPEKGVPTVRASRRPFVFVWTRKKPTGGDWVL